MYTISGGELSVPYPLPRRFQGEKISDFGRYFIWRANPDRLHGAVCETFEHSGSGKEPMKGCTWTVLFRAATWFAKNILEYARMLVTRPRS